MATKRKRPDVVIDLDSDSEMAPVASTSGLRGSAAWKRDVAELKSHYSGEKGPISKFTQGDSEESVEFKMALKGSTKSLRLTVVISDKSDYLSSATFMSWADDDTPDVITDALDTLGERGSITLEQALEFLLKPIAGISKLPAGPALSANGSQTLHAKGSRSSHVDENGYESDDLTDNGADDALFGLTPAHDAPKLETIKKLLHRDFKGLVEAGYRPGHYQIGAGHVVTTSIPISTLKISPRSLDAWDPCLVDPDRCCYLVLLGLYGNAYTSSFDSAARFPPRFAAGLSPKAKPSKEAVEMALRSATTVTYTPGEFEEFSLNKPLDSLMSDCFLEVFDFRRKHHKLGWAGAEQAMRQKKATQSHVVNESSCRQADTAESALQGYWLPDDPLAGGKNQHNVPLAAFAYLVRRFVLCPRFCVICHAPVEHVAIRPFVCSDPLCGWQYQDLSLGPDIEYEIRFNQNPVDLLIQLCFVQAQNGQLQHFPTLNLQVNTSTMARWTGDVALLGLLAIPPGTTTVADVDNLEDKARCFVLCALINEIPPVPEMKKWLEGEGLTESEIATGQTNRKLQDIRGGVIPPVVFKVLRWIITSNTSYLREIEDANELIPNVSKRFRQYRFLQASPQREALYNENVVKLSAQHKQLKTHPDLFAFHGSPLANWHSILREGLHFRKTSHGRAFGHGVYFAQAAETSLSAYAQPHTGFRWRNSYRPITKACAICQVINVPQLFVSQTPHYVVQHIEWIKTKWLLVDQDVPNVGDDQSEAALAAQDAARAAQEGLTPASTLPSVKQDPQRIPTIAGKKLEIPDYVNRLERDRSREVQDLTDEYSAEDAELLREPPVETIDIDSDGDVQMSQPTPKAKKPAEPPYQPFAASKLEHLRVLPPPRSSTRAATMSLQREMRGMLEEQKKVSAKELGWFFDPETLDSGNIYHWIVEMIHFDPDIQLAKDMKRNGVPGVLFEILFSPNFPFVPPFVRVVWPRFLPFAQGGGGHVTAGGSICMDLLTMTSWSSAYTMPAVLLQIKTAISTDPRQARLDPARWNQPYTVQEAIEGFRRAANMHGWAIPPDLEKVALGSL